MFELPAVAVCYIGADIRSIPADAYAVCGTDRRRYSLGGRTTAIRSKLCWAVTSQRWAGRGIDRVGFGVVRKASLLRDCGRGCDWRAAVFATTDADGRSGCGGARFVMRRDCLGARDGSVRSKRAFGARTEWDTARIRLEHGSSVGKAVAICIHW